MSASERRAATSTSLAFVCLLLGCTSEPSPGGCARTGNLCSAAPATYRWAMVPAVGVFRDLDGDSKLDAVLAAPSSGMLLDWYGSGDDQLLLIEGGASGVSVVDVDHDGDDDVVLASLDPPRLWIFGNDGDQRFSELRSEPMDADPQAIWVGTLTVGGPLRIAAATTAPAGLSLYDDELTLVRRHELGAAPVAIEAADVDGDAVLDLAIADFGSASFHLLRGDGAGGLAPARDFATVALPESIDLADIDGDGRADVLVSGRAEARVWLHRGDGAGSFDAGRPIAVSASADASLGVVGIDGDVGEPGWVVMGAGAHLIAAQIDGAAEIQRRVISEDLDRWTQPGESPPLLRLRRDGPRIFVQNAAGHLSVTTERTLGLVERWRAPISHAWSYSIAVGDVDVDGDLDLVIVASDRATVYEAVAPDRWVPGPTTELPRSAHNHSFADVTGDGYPDLLLAEGSSLRVALGDGTGAFEVAGAVELPFAPWGITAIRRADSAGDDVALRGPFGEPGEGAVILRLDAAGEVIVSTALFPEGGATQIRSADVDLDGDQDLVAAVRYTDGAALAIVRNLGGGLWESASSLPLSIAVRDYGLALGDLDLDGTLDAILFGEDASTIVRDVAALDAGMIVVVAHDSIYPDEGVITDVDGDGRPDVLFDYFNGAAALLHPGFGEAEVLGGNDRWSTSLAFTADDGGGRVAIIDAQGLTVSAFEKAPALSAIAGEPGRGPVSHVLAGDLDGDGHVDVVASSATEHHVFWGPVDDGPQEVTDLRPWTGSQVLLADLDGNVGDELVVARKSGKLRLLRGDGRTLSSLDDRDLDGSIEAIVALARAGADPELTAVTSGEGGVVIAAVPIVGERLGEPTLTPIAGPQGELMGTAGGDFDGDGFGDLALLIEEEAPRIWLLWGSHDHTFTTTEIEVDEAAFIIAADVDGDGQDALLVDDGAFLDIVELSGREPLAPTLLPFIAGQADPWPAIAVGDIDGDGVDDVARLNRRGLDVGLGPLPTSSGLGWRRDRDTAYTGLVIADVDGDGVGDVIAHHADGLTIWRSSTRSP